MKTVENLPKNEADTTNDNDNTSQRLEMIKRPITYPVYWQMLKLLSFSYKCKRIPNASNTNFLNKLQEHVQD